MPGQRIFIVLIVVATLVAGCGGSASHVAKQGTNTASQTGGGTKTGLSRALKAACAHVSNDINIVATDSNPLLTQISARKVEPAAVRKELGDVRIGLRHASALIAAAPARYRNDIVSYSGALAQERKGTIEAGHGQYTAANNALVAASDRTGPFQSDLNQICP